MDTTKISNVQYSVERPTESCIVRRPGDTKCMVCGRDAGYPTRSCHPGPAITVHGSFEMTEHHELWAAALADMRLCDLDNRLDAEQEGLAIMPVTIVECKIIGTDLYEYRFSVSMFIGVPCVA